MRRTIFFCVIIPGLCLVTCRSLGQSVDYTQYYANLAAVNPAFTGIEDYLDIKLGIWQGWNGFNVKNNEAYISAFGTIARRDIAAQNSLRVSDPSVYTTRLSDHRILRQERRRHGIGGMISSRNVGPYRSFRSTLNYAYHLPLSRKLNWSLGAMLGYSDERIDLSEFHVRDEVSDLFFQELINSTDAHWSSFVADFGTALYSKRFYMALSTQNMVRADLQNENPLTSSFQPRYLLQTATTINASPNTEFSIGGQANYSDGYDLGWGLNARFRYREFGYVGVAYYNDVRASLLIGFSLSNNMSLQYAYNQYLGGLDNFNVHSNELIIGIALFNRYSVPTRAW